LASSTILLSGLIQATTNILFSFVLMFYMSCGVLLAAAQVLSVEGAPTICYAESAQAVLAAQFEARAHMHEHVYQHQHVKAVECMVADALFAAKHVLRIHELASR
jgi:hypothetical protein